jgi:hypothetical protein
MQLLIFIVMPMVVMMIVNDVLNLGFIVIFHLWLSIIFYFQLLEKYRFWAQDNYFIEAD